jgi:putative Mg2+ transporter-C (MgtC) family protein
MILDTEIMLRLLLAAVLGAVVGFEREYHQQSAGLRTHIILVIGSTLAMTLSINLAMMFRPLVPNGDPARLAAQVLAGIGFLGAGAILREGLNVRGLTTATSLWTMAVVGLAVGAGYYLVAVVTTILLMIVLTILDMIERRVFQDRVTRFLTITADSRAGLEEEAVTMLHKHSRSVRPISVEKQIRRKRMRVTIEIKLPTNCNLENILAEVSEIPGVRLLKIE